MFAAGIQQTIQRAYRDIRNGDDPWVAIGDFSHDWFGNYANQRVELVSEPLELSDETETPQTTNAPAAMGGFLCSQRRISLPSGRDARA